MWHVLASSPVDFETFRKESAADRMPSHLLAELASSLDANLVAPEPARVTRIDRMLALLYGLPHHWEMARRVFPTVADGDAVFTTGCDSGVPLALLCALRRRRVAFAINFVDPSRLRSKLVGWILASVLKRFVVLVTLAEQAETARRSFGRRATDVVTIGYTTDCRFFRPDPTAVSDGTMPLIAGCGTEQRDYLTLAEAIAPLDVESSICFVSPNFSAKTRFTVPDPVPDNMEFRHYEFDELRSLYQHADVMVVPLLENRFSAGLTALFEAIACECPVIITTSPGIIGDLVADDLVIGVQPGSVSDLRQALKVVLTERTEARARAKAARAHLVDRYSTESFVNRLDDLLAGLVDDPPASTAR